MTSPLTNRWLPTCAARTGAVLIAGGAIVSALSLVGCGHSEAMAEPRTVEFLVDGMHCDGCADAIVGSISDIPGVTACRVDHVEGTAAIDVTTSDPEIEARLAEAIAALKFVVRRPAVGSARSSGPSTGHSSGPSTGPADADTSSE